MNEISSRLRADGRKRNASLWRSTEAVGEGVLSGFWWPLQRVGWMSGEASVCQGQLCCHGLEGLPGPPEASQSRQAPFGSPPGGSLSFLLDLFRPRLAGWLAEGAPQESLQEDLQEAGERALPAAASVAPSLRASLCAPDRLRHCKVTLPKSTRGGCPHPPCPGCGAPAPCVSHDVWLRDGLSWVIVHFTAAPLDAPATDNLCFGCGKTLQLQLPPQAGGFCGARGRGGSHLRPP